MYIFIYPEETKRQRERKMSQKSVILAKEIDFKS